MSHCDVLRTTVQSWSGRMRTGKDKETECIHATSGYFLPFVHLPQQGCHDDWESFNVAIPHMTWQLQSSWHGCLGNCIDHLSPISNDWWWSQMNGMNVRVERTMNTRVNKTSKLYRYYIQYNRYHYVFKNNDSHSLALRCMQCVVPYLGCCDVIT